ncbi:MAG: AAA family ATPase [Nanoarchaeota archaeon]|nr:AAA family ATPase [Nanoarchaeota archaeon]
MGKFKIKRESTGIIGIDKMIDGGFPQEGVIGISGPPGVGKSIFSLHFILEGARKGQKSVYINLEEPRKNICNMIHQFDFGKEFLELEEKGLIIIKCFDYNKYEKIQEDLLDHVKNDKEIQRLVIDSFNCFFASNYNAENKAEATIRKMIIDAFYKIRRRKLTTLLTLEKDNGTSSFNIPYLVDGTIALDYLDMGTIERRIFIPKMRWTNQCKDGKSYDICEQGIKIDDTEWGE